MDTEYVLSYTGSEIDEKLGKIDSLATKSEIPTKTSQLNNDSGFLTSVPSEYITEIELNTKGYLTEHQDLSEYALKSEIPTVTVQSVNGQTGAINLEAEDVGALSVDTVIPTKTSQLTNDSGFIAGYTETDPTVPAWAKTSTKPAYTKSEVGLGNVDNVKQYSANNPPPYPVTSINGKSGAVTLTSNDVGAEPFGATTSVMCSHNIDISAHEDMREQINNLSIEIADKEQLKPEFANSVEECVDTSKLYVLPDGYIYGYMTKITTINPTNQIRESINSDKSQYVGGNGEDGYATGKRLSNSTGAETDLASYAVTGFIKCSVSDVIRTKNIEFDTSATNSQIHFYDSNFGHILYIAGGSSTNSLTSILNADGNVEGSISQSTNTLTNTQKSSIAYIRIAGLKFGDTAMVTLNEPLEPSTTTEVTWYNTGHAFVPADYEDRIIEIESRTASLENRMDEISVGDDGTFTYVVEEAKRVADIVQTKRTVGSLTFTAMSDLHVEDSLDGIANNLTSCRDAGLGLSELQKHLRLDFAAMLGDYSYTPTGSTVEQVKKDIAYVKKCMTDGMKDVPNIWCTGNHDINYIASSDRRMTEDELYAYLTSNNKGTMQDSDHIGRNYGYIDFENQKIRCIYLNTIDALDYPDNTDGTADDASEITAIQTQWLVNVGLNLTDKADPTEWGIVTFSHHCLSIFPQVTTVLTAYKNGTSGSIDVVTNNITTTVNYNFTSINRGEVICAIHGHNHNFNYRKISSEKWTQTTEENAWLWSIGVPATETTRDNEVATNSDTTYANFFGEFDVNGNPIYYRKTQGTAKSTSFCVITIDRKNRKVHAIAYGAGIDREINY